MNILEAIEAVKNGKVVKYGKKKDVSYIIQTTLHPIGIKELQQIDLETEVEREVCPLELKDLTLESLCRICVEAILEESFSTLSVDEMLLEIQTGWKKHND